MAADNATGRQALKLKRSAGLYPSTVCAERSDCQGNSWLEQSNFDKDAPHWRGAACDGCQTCSSQRGFFGARELHDPCGVVWAYTSDRIGFVGVAGLPCCLRPYRAGAKGVCDLDTLIAL